VSILCYFLTLRLVTRLRTRPQTSWMYFLSIGVLYIHYKTRRHCTFETNGDLNWNEQEKQLFIESTQNLEQKKLHGLSPRANYTDRATAACRRSDCQLFADRGVPRGHLNGSLRPYSRFSRQEPLLFYQVAPQLYSRGWVEPRSRPTTFFIW
jgi:hypothetical protein